MADLANIGIASIGAAHAGLDAWRPDAVVSISSPPRRPLPVAEGLAPPWPHLHLRFHDIEAAVHGHRRGPTLAHIEALVAFMRDHQPRRLLIHCRAGLSRSPAFALVAMLETGTPADVALDALRAAIPQAQPNRRILALAGDRYDVPMAEMASELFTYHRAPWGAVGDMLSDIVTIQTTYAPEPDALRLVRAI